jgi:hypothetical protein
MRLHQILSRPAIILTNEEQDFVSRHPHEISIGGLYDRDRVIAQTLLRKGIYEISKDSKKLQLQKDDTNSNRTI